MRKCFTVFFPVLLFLVPALIQAQTEKDNVNAQLWLDITLFNEYSDKIEFYGDGGYRRIFGSDRPWNRFYIRPAVKYSPVPWLGIRGGVGLFFTERSSVPNALELRPWQGVSIGWPKFAHFRFSHYFRLEQRWNYDTETWDNSFDLRYRYQLSGRYQPNISKKTKYLYFPAFVELFANQSLKDEVQELFANEMRIGLGIGFPWNIYWSGQFVFIFQRSRNDMGDFKTSDLLFRFSIRHELVPNRPMQRLED